MDDEEPTIVSDDFEQFIALLVELADEEGNTASDQELWEIALREEKFTALRRVIES